MHRTNLSGANFDGRARVEFSFRPVELVLNPDGNIMS
jgi:hypothetical protein